MTVLYRNHAKTNFHFLPRLSSMLSDFSAFARFPTIRGNLGFLINTNERSISDP